MRKYILTSMDEFKEAEKYWLEKLSGELHEVKLYGDFPRIKQYMHKEASYKTIFGKEETARLIQISKNNDLSLYIILLVSFKILLFKWLGQNDIIVASPIYTISNRKYSKYVFFRDTVHSRMNFKDLLAEVKKTVVEGYKNEHFPVKEMMMQLELPEDMSLSRVVLLLENIHQREFINDIRKEYENDIVFSIRKKDSHLEAEIIYNSEVFKQETIEKLSFSYKRISTQVLNSPDIKISEIELIKEDEKNKILFDFNSTANQYPENKTIHQLFEEQVKKTPHRVAVNSHIDLSDIYKELKNEAINHHPFEEIKKCCFKKNPFVFTFDVETSASPGSKPIKIVKTQRHTCVIVNNNVVELLKCFDGETNIKSIFSQLKNMNLTFYVYPINIEDILEIACTFTGDVKKFSGNRFDEFVRLLKLLYQNYLIDLTDFRSSGPLKQPVVENFTANEGFDETVILDDLFNQSKRVTRADVLFIGDTPGMPTVGLLYMASFLWRNGFKALCHFNDLNGDYLSLKKNIQDLLDKIKPKVVGISMKWFPYMARVLEICKIVKNHSPAVKLVLGGNTASFYYEKVIKYDFVDYVVRGDGEIPILRICQGADHLPNCVYKQDGKLIVNPITYVHDEINSKDIYLSHLDKILISRYSSIFGSFFIPTQKGCTLNCCYCGGCRDAQKKTFGRKGIFRRGIEEVRKDIIEAKKYASLYMFDFIESNEFYVDYIKKITQGIDLSSHFCIYGNYIAPSDQVMALVSSTFKYVYWELDMATLSQRHRDQLVSLNLVKLQPSDEDIIDFYNDCEKYEHGEVRMNLIAGLPYFNQEDIKESNNMFSHIIKTYQCFSDFHWGRLHAQPGASITYEAQKHNMYSYATNYEDFLKYSQMNFDHDSPHPCVEDYNYPYIYFTDEELNSAVSRYSAETRSVITQYKEKRREGSLVGQELTYQQLNQRANQLARVLREKGIENNQPVGLLMESSLEMVVGLLAVLKAGGFYIPVDPTYPEARQKYILKDSNVDILLAQAHLLESNKKLFNSLSMKHIVPVDDHSLYSGDTSNLNIDNKPADLAYIIFTSGTTGKPKGVMVEHNGLVNYTTWRIKTYNLSHDDVTLQPLPYSFDGFGSNFYSSLLSGGTLIMIPDSKRIDFDYMKDAVYHKHVTNVSLVPPMYQALLDQAEKYELKTLRFVVLAGDKSPEEMIKKSREKTEKLLHFNEYGPTELTVTATGHAALDEENTAIIGTPIANTQINILDASLKLVPVNVPGELCITGVGVARGYINNPESTVEKFITPSSGNWGKMYRTGDLARWLPDGKIEFFGRIDQQVKIRGLRIELEEIENQLLKYEEISEAVVLAKEDKDGDKHLCAYIVPQSSHTLNTSELREHLMRELPDYMIPSYFIKLDRFVLTPNGKIDKKNLPDPKIAAEAGGYAAPRNEIEEKLVEIWSEILETEKDRIGIDSNFFELGGHSLKATIMASKIHKELKIKLSLVEMFKNPTIRGLWEIIKGLTKDKYSSIEPAEKKDYYVLSSAQERLYILQQFDPESTGYNVSMILRLEENLDNEKFEKALKKLISRHESLRTSFEMVNGEPFQKIHHEVDFEIEYYDAERKGQSAERKEEIHAPCAMCHASIIENFVRPFDLSKVPLLRVGLIKEEDQVYILMVDMHHIISDGVSSQVLIKDFMVLYTGKNLFELRLQYKDYSEWQNSKKVAEAIKKQEEYWIKEFKGDIPVLNLPTDYSRPAVQSFEGSVIRFDLSEEETLALSEMARSQGATLFMVVLAAYYIFLSKLSSQEDIVIGTPIAGQKLADLKHIIGMFVNTLALRNYLSGMKTFSGFLSQVRERTLKAFENQDYQFEELVENAAVERDVSRNPLFDTAFVFQNTSEAAEKISEQNINGLKVKPYIYEHMTSKFDLTLTAVKGRENLNFTFEYCTKLFKAETIERFTHYFRKIVTSVLENSRQEIWKIEILPGSEKRLLLYEFNDTAAEYPKDKTLHELFEEQAEKTPDSTAAVGVGMRFIASDSRKRPVHITYDELNKQSHQSACLLREKGVTPDTIVGIMVEQSIEMIEGILGILKSGGAYLPIDPDYPQDRIKYMLGDSGASVLLTGSGDIKDHRWFGALQERKALGFRPYLTVPRSPITDFDGLPFPDRSMVDYEKYNRYIGQAMVKNSISLQGTRGCPYHCAYCHKIWPKKHVVRSAENIFAEVQLYYNMGIKRFVIIDDIFNLDRVNSARFFELIIEKGLNLQLFFPNGLRGDLLNEEYIDLMVEAGTVGLALALETASPRLQKLIGKHLNLDKLRKNIEYFCRKYPRVILELFTMHGFPTETEAEAMLTLEFIKSLKWLHFPYVHILKIYPNTNMEKLAIENGIPQELIAGSANLAYHELPETLPFDKDFTIKYQADFLNNYFLSKERLLHVLPYQLKILTRDEIVQKYHSYLPVEIKNFAALLGFAGISEEELKVDRSLDENSFTVPGLNKKIKSAPLIGCPRRGPAEGIKILLLDLSQYFSAESGMLYDVVEPPLGLMYIMTYLKDQFPGKINGKIAKSRIDFDSYDQLKSLLEEFQPDVVGVRTLTFYKDFFHRTAARIRQWGFVGPFIAGGPYATSDYASILQDANVDLVVIGEGEQTFAQLVREIINNNGQLPGEEVLKQIPGIAYIPLAERQSKPFGGNRQIIFIGLNKSFCGGSGVMRKAQSAERKANTRFTPCAKRHASGAFPLAAGGRNKPFDLAYIIYTSGTTGRPKGVLIEHRNVIRLLFTDQFQFDFNSRDVWTMFHSFCFDFSVWEMWGALLYGGQLVIIPKMTARDSGRYLEILKTKKVTILNQTPSAFYHLMHLELKQIQKELNIRYVIFGGEALSPDRLKEWKAKYPDTKLINMYGITETTVHVTFKEIGDSDFESHINNIGKPLPTLSTYVMDKNLKLQPVGVAGELVVGGEGVGRGYLNRPELSKEKFVENPYKPGEKLYRSGDLVRLSAKEELEYLGRIDLQVQIRGFRVELGEIQSQLYSHNEIEAAVVLAKEDEDGYQSIYAYILSENALNVSQLREYLSKKLPDYMIPAHFIQIEKIPLTPNGKVDRKALSVFELRLDTGVEYAAPESEMEKTIAGIWKEELKLDKAGIYDNFFDLGGNSLHIIKVVNKLKEVLGREIAVVDMFAYPTIHSFSQYLLEQEVDDTLPTKKIEESVELMEDAMQMLIRDESE